MQKPMGNKFRYYLTYNSVERELIFAPRGYEDTKAQFRRDLSGYFGLIRSLSLPLTFVEDGYNICRFAFLNDGYEAGVRLRVDVRQRNWSYKTIFVGDLDFSKYVPNGLTCDVPLMESGISRDIKANENTKYEFELTGTDVVNIILPGIGFNEKSSWITKYVDPNDLNAAKRYVLGVDLITNGYGSNYLTALNTNTRNASDSDDFSGDYFVKCNRVGGVNVRVKGRLKGYLLTLVGSTQTFTVQITSNKFPFIVNTPVELTTTGTIGDLTVFDVALDFNWNMQEGEGWFIYIRSGATTTNHRLIVTEGEIAIDYSAVSDPSNCKGIRGFDLIKRALNRVSPGILFSSSLLNTKWNDLIFTSGTAIRELANPKIKISFKELFQTFNSIDDVGFGDDGGVYKLEERRTFARNVEIVNVGGVKQGGYQMEIAEELVGNVVNVGYIDKNTENTDGLEEYNSGQIYGLPTSRIQKEIDWISPIRADQFGIEKMRVDFNISKKSTNDTNSDNDTFMIDCYLDDTNYRPILGSSYSSITGLSSPNTAYNLRLTPKQNLLRHAGYLASILDRMPGRYIEFASGDKNTDLATVKDGISVIENAPVSVASLAGKYFQPYIFTISVKFPKYVIDLIDATPFAKIGFSYNGIKASGYIIELPVDLAENKEVQIKLLASADTLIP